MRLLHIRAVWRRPERLADIWTRPRRHGIFAPQAGGGDDIDRAILVQIDRGQARPATPMPKELSDVLAAVSLRGWTPFWSIA